MQKRVIVPGITIAKYHQQLYLARQVLVLCGSIEAAGLIIIYMTVDL
jgi:hypothetical protein